MGGRCSGGEDGHRGWPRAIDWHVLCSLVVPHVRSYATSHDGEKDLSVRISRSKWTEIRWIFSWAGLLKQNNHCWLPG